MRITVTAKAELEEYIQSEMVKTGLAAGTITYFLAMDGMNYRKAMQMAGKMDDFMKRLEQFGDQVKMKVSENSQS